MKLLLTSIVALAALGAENATPAKFLPVDLKAIVNTDPLSKASPFIEGAAFQLPDWQWIEAESVYKKSEGVTVEQRARASGGDALGGAWGKKAGDWAEWNFDLPWGSDNMQLFLRLARRTGNQVAKMNFTWDGETGRNAFVPLTAGGGDADADYETGLVRIELNRQQMGRHILHIATEGENDTISLDGFWLCDGLMDMVNRIGKDGKMKPPATVHNFVFPPGPRTIRGIDFTLIDPDDNGAKAYYLSTDSAFVLPVADKTATACHLLGGGIRVQPNRQFEPKASTAKATIAYSTGPEENVDVTFDPIYKRGEVQGAAVTLGLGRVGYIIKIPLDATRTLREIRIQATDGRFAVLAASLELAAGK